MNNFATIVHGKHACITLFVVLGELSYTKVIHYAARGNSVVLTAGSSSWSSSVILPEVDLLFFFLKVVTMTPSCPLTGTF